jgi:hypothetical protein
VSDTRVGLAFHEVMAGPFGADATDPAQGAAAANAVELVMRGAITIRDVDVFIENPSHVGRLDVRFDWPPFGTDLDGSGGVFNLLRSSGEPDLKLMVYQWPAAHQGKSYYFAGEKHVRHHHLRDVWKDTTTLYTHLHEGPDTTGPIVGAGIITLSVAELVKMVASFQPLEAQTGVDRVRAVAEFGRFFLGELWDIYARTPES